ncbi:hypothetical protein LCGC14_2351180, partial [marine sediment metagenome]
PLFLARNRWEPKDGPFSLWQSEGRKAVATIQADGGVIIENYSKLIWWRPVWTLDMLVIMKSKGMLEDMD